MLDIKFFWIAFWLYFAGFVLYIFWLGFDQRIISKSAFFMMILGFIPHTVAIILRWIKAGHGPFYNMYGYMTIMAWTSVLLFIVLILITKKSLIGVFLSPVSFLLIACASVLPKDLSYQLVPALQSTWFYIHVIMSIFGEGAFAVAFGVSIMLLIGSNKKDKKLSDKFPSLELLDEINYRAISVGYPLFTVGALIAGSIWAAKAWGAYWSWDSKEVGALVIWLFYTVYLHSRYVKGWKGTKAALMSIIGFIVTLLSFFGNMFLGGLHAYV